MSELEFILGKRIKDEALPEPTIEHRFHPQRKWRFDFAWPKLLIAAEVEGGSWVHGAHGRGKHFASDCSKYNEAQLLGWQVYRFTGDMIKSGEAIRTLKRAMGEK